MKFDLFKCSRPGPADVRRCGKNTRERARAPARARARARARGRAGARARARARGLVIIPYLSSLKILTPLIPNTPLADTRVVQSFLVWHRTREYDVKIQSPVFRSGGHQQGRVGSI